MPKPKIGKTKNGEVMHYSVAAIIERDGKYLMIDRNLTPFGYAGLAGHIDEGEDTISALHREVKEESNLVVKKQGLLYEEELIQESTCVMGVKPHYWYIFKCAVSGEIKLNEKEAKSIDWYSPEEIKKLKLEPSWGYWLKRLKII